MDLSAPHRAVAPTVEGAVLMVLARVTRPLSGREIGRLAGRSEAGVRRALRRLSEHGLVKTDEAGKTLLHSLNRDHLAAPAVEILTNMRAELLRRIKIAIAEWSIKPLEASLFGSSARGDGSTGSDIDLLVVRPPEVSGSDPVWEEQIRELSSSVLRWTGNHASVAELSPTDAELIASGDLPNAEEIGRDAIPLWDGQAS